MSDFVLDNTALPNTKSDRKAIPGGANADQYWAAADANIYQSIVSSLRSTLRNAYIPQSYTASSGAYTPILNSGRLFQITLDAALTINAPTVGSIPIGSRVVFVFKQDNTGGRLVTFNATAYPDAAAFQTRQGPNQYSSIQFILNSDGKFKVDMFKGIDLTKELDIRDFGAKEANLESGDHADIAINAAIALAATLPGLRTVVVPDGQWYMEAPAILNHSNVRLRGQSKFNTTLLASGAQAGPHILIVPPTASWVKPTLGAGLATGAGGSWPMDGTNHYWLNYADMHMMSLNALAQVCVEFYAKVTSVTQGSFLSARGGVSAAGNHFNNHITLQFRVEGDDGSGKAQIRARLEVNGTLYTVTSSVGVTLNAVHHLALTYDGTTIRLFADGVSVGSQAATGSTVSYAFENLVLGPEQGQNAGSFVNMASGSVDSIRISKTARYTTGFTAPTAKLVVDANTLMLHNFDDENAYLSNVTFQTFVPSANQLPTWIAFQRGDNPGPANQFVQVSDLSLSSTPRARGGIQGFATAAGSISDISCSGGAVIRMENNCFEWDIRNIYGNSGTLSGTNFFYPKSLIYLQNASGAGLITGVFSTGYVYPVFLSGSSTKVKDCLITPTIATVYGGVAIAYGGLSGMTFDNYGFDDEVSTPNLQGGMFLSAILNANILGGALDIAGAGGSLPAITVADCGVLNVMGTSLGVASVSALAVHSIDSITQINLMGLDWLYSVGVWSDDFPNTTILDGSSFSSGLHAVTGATLTLTGGTWLSDATGGAVTANLPAAVTRAGLEIIVKKVDSGGNAVTVTRAGSDTIDGATTKALATQYKFVRLVSDGVSKWNIVGSN